VAHQHLSLHESTIQIGNKPKIITLPGRPLRPAKIFLNDPQWVKYQHEETGVRINTKEPVWILQVLLPLSLAFARPIGNLLALPEELGKGQTPFGEFSARLRELSTAVVEPLLIWAPFWLDAWLGQGWFNTWLPWEMLLILYRFTEALLETIQEWHYPAPQLNESFLLLLRQRFRYLVGLQKSDSRNWKKRLPDHESAVRRARQEYGEALLTKPDMAELAFGRAAMDAGWSLDEEVQMLIFDRNHLWPFAFQEQVDRLFTDRLVREWMLARDDISSATRVVQALLSRSAVQFDALTADSSGKSSIQTRQHSLGHSFFYWLLGNVRRLTILGALFAMFGLASGSILNLSEVASIPVELLVAVIWLMYVLALLSGLCLACVLAAMLGAVFRRKPTRLSRQSLYLLVVRIPAMGLVGVLAAAGLADAYINFAFNGFSGSVWLVSIVILLASLSAAYLYILLEVKTKVDDPKQARKRSCSLWWYGWAASFWLALFSAWSADAIGLTHCEPPCRPQALNPCISWNGWSVIPLQHWTTLFGQRISLDYVVIVSALALLVGVFTQIFWEDKSIAEPL